MESRTAHDRDLLIDELTRVQELARQLEAHLNQPSPIESCKPLAQGILYSIDKAIYMAKSSRLESQIQAAYPSVSTGSFRSFIESKPTGSSDFPVAMEVEGHPSAPTSSTAPPRSTIDSEQSEYFTSDQPMEASRKSKSPSRRVTPCTTVRVPTLDDGYTWRKYGQKDVLGAKHPRGYYRCTHRNSFGCLATRQVQRSDEDPTLFDVTYHGEHTCRPSLASISETVSLEQGLQKSPTNLQDKSEGSVVLGGDDERGVGNWKLPSFGGDDEREVGNWTLRSSGDDIDEENKD